MQKKYIILIAGVVIFTLFLLIFKHEKDLVNDNTYIVVGDNTRWKYVDDEWEDLDITSKKFTNTEFKVYKNQVYQGDFYLQNYNDTWYFFDKNNISQELESGNLFAYSSNIDFKMINFITEDMTLQEINKILKEYDIKINNLDEISYAKKIEYDVDGDNIKEYIYSISNLKIENKEDINFSFVIYSNNRKQKPLVEKVKKAQYIYTVSNIIDFNNDGKVEIVIEHGKPMNPSYNCHSMYELRSGKYIITKTC